MALIHESRERILRTPLFQASEPLNLEKKRNKPQELRSIYSEKDNSDSKATEKTVPRARFFMPEMLE